VLKSYLIKSMLVDDTESG